MWWGVEFYNAHERTAACMPQQCVPPVLTCLARLESRACSPLRYLDLGSRFALPTTMCCGPITVP